MLQNRYEHFDEQSFTFKEITVHVLEIKNDGK